MWGFTNSGGSDLINAFAIITVTYPAGSICTCTNGTVTLTAGSTSGIWAFGVPVGGEWTIECHDTAADERAEYKIEVEQYGIYTCVLSYWNGELYDVGNQYEKVTGGWTARKQGASAVFEIREDGMYIKGASSNACNGATVNPIDITDWNYITFYSKAGVSFSAGSNRIVGITQKTTYAGAGDVSAKANLLPNGQATTINITSYTGEWYPVFSSLNGNDYTITKIIMTK